MTSQSNLLNNLDNLLEVLMKLQASFKSYTIYIDNDLLNLNSVSFKKLQLFNTILINPQLTNVYFIILGKTTINYVMGIH